MKTHQPAHLKPRIIEERVLRYGIGEQQYKSNAVNMWKGPFINEKMLLEIEGISSKSRIIRFNKDGIGTDEIIWWWNNNDLLWEDEPR